MKDGLTEITNEWLFEYVVPTTRRHFQNDSRFCQVMGLALLYICLGDNEDVFVLTQLKDRVRAAYAQLRLEEAQPIKKVQLHVYRNNGILMIDALNDNVGSSGAAATGGTMSNEIAHTLVVCLSHVESQVAQTQVHFASLISNLRTFCGIQFKLLNNNIRCYGGTIQGSLVRQRASNSKHWLLRQGEENEALDLVEV